MNGKALAPVVLVVLALAPGPTLAAESKKQDPAGDFDARYAEGVRLHDAGQYEAAIALYRESEDPLRAGLFQSLRRQAEGRDRLCRAVLEAALIAR